MDRARELAADSHRTARDALAEAQRLRSAGAPQAPTGVTGELEQIADFIYTRTS